MQQCRCRATEFPIGAQTPLPDEKERREYHEQDVECSQSAPALSSFLKPAFFWRCCPLCRLEAWAATPSPPDHASDTRQYRQCPHKPVSQQEPRKRHAGQTRCTAGSTCAAPLGITGQRCGIVTEQRSNKCVPPDHQPVEFSRLSCPSSSSPAHLFQSGTAFGHSGTFRFALAGRSCVWDCRGLWIPSPEMPAYP